VKNEIKFLHTVAIDGLLPYLLLQRNRMHPTPLKKYKSPDSDQIPAELIQAGDEILLLEIHKLINSLWNKEELPDQLKESIIVPIHKKDDKTDCNNYRGISLLSTSYKILSNILLSRLVRT
jgi:hypothetical protein